MKQNQIEKWLTTNEFTARLGVKGETARRSYCVNGHYLNVKPKKLPNGRLLWPGSEVDKLLSSETEAA